MIPYSGERLLPEYIFWNLRGRYYAIRDITGQDQRRGLNMKLVGQLSLPIPPLAEQKRIVAKVDELMALCDQLEAQQQEREQKHAALARASLARFADAPNPANLNFLFHSSFHIHPSDLRKSILTLAVQGKLVPQDPNDEPADIPALSRVTKSKSEREAPFELPGKWKWMQLGQISELINGDRSKNYPNKAEYVPEGVAWINTGHIEPDGTLSVVSMHHITRKKFDSLRSGKVRSGDLVYCLRGATLGKAAIITQFQEGAVASSLVIIRLSPGVDPRFAYRFLTSPLGREQIFQFSNGAAQPNLSANNVKKYWIPLPPLAEQRRIVAKVDQLMALVDALETQLAASRTAAANLLSALVAELTGTPGDRTASAPPSKGTGRRGRPPKS
jgi:type I restriction enzyme S subunit